MANSFGALDEMIARCKRLGGDSIPEDVAREAAPLVAQAVKATAASGTTPLGASWRPKKTGGRPMLHAADHITVTPRGRFVEIKLAGPDVWHHRGSKKFPRRQVIPDGASVPPSVTEAVTEAARRVFRRIVGGRA